MKNFIFLLMLIPLGSWSQVKDYTIEISAARVYANSTGDLMSTWEAPFSEFNIRMAKERDRVKIIYGRSDAFGGSQNIISDSIIVMPGDKFINFLNNFSAIDTDSLKRKEKRRAISEGLRISTAAGITFRIIQKSGDLIEKDIYVHHPNIEKFTDIYLLIHSALNLYREKFPTSPLLDLLHTY